MLERFERPLKIICAAMVALLVLQLANLLWRGDPLAHLKIPALPTLPETTNEPAKTPQKERGSMAGKKTGTNDSNGTNSPTVTNAMNGSNPAAATNSTNGTIAGRDTNVVKGTNDLMKIAGNRRGADTANKPPGMPSGITPEMMAGGGMPGGRRGGGMKKVDLPPEVQARVDRIINSEILGPRFHPMPVALIGISDEEAFIRSTNGQTGPVKVGGEIGGVKLLHIGINRVLVEQEGEKRELTLFSGLGGESLLPKTTNAPSTNAASTNALPRRSARRGTATNQVISSTQTENH